MSKAGIGTAQSNIEIEVNGRRTQVPAGATIVDLIAQLALGDQRCAVEVNKELVRRDRHKSHVLKAGDRVEVVTLVGGG